MKIAIAGKMGAGKNEVFNILKELNPSFKELKFATPIYNIVDFSQISLGLKKSKDGIFMQFLGSHIRKTQGDDFFAKLLFEKNCTNNSVITDLRRPVELSYCKKNNFVIVRVERNAELRRYCSKGRNMNHETETALDNISQSSYDLIIDNNGSLNELRKIVESFYNNLK